MDRLRGITRTDYLRELKSLLLSRLLASRLMGHSPRELSRRNGGLPTPTPNSSSTQMFIEHTVCRTVLDSGATARSTPLSMAGLLVKETR